MYRHIPNLLTACRIVAIPFLLYIMLSSPISEGWLAFILFAFLSITDFADGYLARRWKVQSRLGAFLDPAADKLLVTAVLITLITSHTSVYFVLPAIVIIFRELLMSMLREYMARNGNSDALAVDAFGKYKTASQMLTLALFLQPNTQLLPLAYAFLYLSAFLTVFSIVRYINKVKAHFLPAVENAA